MPSDDALLALARRELLTRARRHGRAEQAAVVLDEAATMLAGGLEP